MVAAKKDSGVVNDQFSHRTYPVDNVFSFQKNLELENLVRRHTNLGHKIHSNHFYIIPVEDSVRERYSFEKTISEILDHNRVYDRIYHKENSMIRELMAYSDTTMISIEVVKLDDNLLDKKEIKGCNISIFTTQILKLNTLIANLKAKGFKTVRNLYSNVEDNEVPIKYAFPDSYDIVIQEKSFEALPFSEICDNYTNDVQEKYNRSVKIINDSRSGLVVLNGPPGTGKSYLLRSLLSDVRERQGIICIPAIQFLNDVGKMSNVMAENKKSIVILEDVGEILSVEGHMTHESAVSNLLNMTEGFLSFLSDTIFVATFNYELDKINPALLRPGRCIGRISVGNLDSTHAQRLVGEEIQIPKNREYALSEVYQIKNSGAYVEGELVEHRKSAGFIH